MVIFEIISKLNKKIKLTKTSFSSIKIKHPEITGQEDKLKETLLNPNIIRKSQHASDIWLFYKLFTITPVTRKYLMVAIKVLNEEGFVVTAYFTDRIKLGEEIWKEK